MFCELVLSSESFAALVAPEGRYQVPLQMASCKTGVVALVTLDWFFSHIWFLIMCDFKSLVVMLENAHIEHLWGFSPEWVLLWVFRLLEQSEVKSHWLH